MMKNAFYIILRALSVLKRFKFFHNFLVMQQNFMTSQPGLHSVTIHIFPNISQNKGNQKMKFGQLIEYN